MQTQAWICPIALRPRGAASVTAGGGRREWETMGDQPATAFDRCRHQAQRGKGQGHRGAGAVLG